jgi:hypothetical protein
MEEAAPLAFNVSVPSDGLQGRSRLENLMHRGWTFEHGAGLEGGLSVLCCLKLEHTLPPPTFTIHQVTCHPCTRCLLDSSPSLVRCP